MNRKKIQSALEWGLFYGVITWFLGTGVSNRIPGEGVWTIVLNRVVLAFLIVFLADRWKTTWWLRGLMPGLALSIPVGWYAATWPYYTAVTGWVGALSTGLVTGILIAWHLRKMEYQLKEAEAAS